MPGQTCRLKCGISTHHIQRKPCRRCRQSRFSYREVFEHDELFVKAQASRHQIRQRWSNGCFFFIVLVVVTVARRRRSSRATVALHFALLELPQPLPHPTAAAHVLHLHRGEKLGRLAQLAVQGLSLQARRRQYQSRVIKATCAG